MSETNDPPIWSQGPRPRLQASRHRDSGALRFPPFPAHSPLAASHETIDVEGAGRVHSLTVIHPNPKSGQPPFALGYVDLPGLRVLGRIEPVAARIGDACEAAPDARFGYVFIASPKAQVQA